jgi:hypothetical protein
LKGGKIELKTLNRGKKINEQMKTAIKTTKKKQIPQKKEKIYILVIHHPSASINIHQAKQSSK